MNPDIGSVLQLVAATVSVHEVCYLIMQQSTETYASSVNLRRVRVMKLSDLNQPRRSPCHVTSPIHRLRQLTETISFSRLVVDGSHAEGSDHI